MNSCALTIIVLSTAILAGAQNVIDQNLPVCDPSQIRPSLKVTSDTKGVDFDPYMRIVKGAIREKWYSLIPSPATVKSLCVSIQFKLTRGGRVAEMQYESISGDVELDHAAWAGLMAAEPFPPLPHDFKGDNLCLHFKFFYNPSPEVMSSLQKSDSRSTPTDQAGNQDDPLTADSQLLPTDKSALVPVVPKIVPDHSDISTGRIAQRVDPQYPKEARKRGAQGKVVLLVTVEKNGNVSDIAILSGDLILADAAVDAVSGWRFEPYLQSGSPVQASQKLEFDFVQGEKIGRFETQLQPPTAVAPLATVTRDQQSDGKVYRVGHGVTAPRAIYAPDPLYSEAARKAKYQGTCVLSLIVGPDGHPRDIEVVRALGMGLDAKAVEAVSMWKFSPAMKDGEPVAVLINVETQFHLY